MKKQELKEALGKGHAEFAQFVLALSDDNFCFALPAKWSAGQQLQHIVLSLAALNRAMHNPKYIAPITEMEPQRPFMGFDELVDVYNKVIRKGTEAPASFVPCIVVPGQKEQIVSDIKNGVTALFANMDGYTELELDTLTLPHPKIGRLSVREMLYFTIQHAKHHYSLANESSLQP